jgi:periplasmic copper chaperone A
MRRRRCRLSEVATSTRTRGTVAAIGAVAAFALTACGGGTSQIEVSAAQAAVPVSGSSQVVVTVTNTGDGRDRLTGASTPAALGVELHVTEIVEGRASMRQLDEVEVPPGQPVPFRPGGLHLMLVVPDETVVLGATFELTLHFDRHDDVTVPVEVVELFDLTG